MIAVAAGTEGDHSQCMKRVDDVRRDGERRRKSRG